MISSVGLPVVGFHSEDEAGAEDVCYHVSDDIAVKFIPQIGHKGLLSSPGTHLLIETIPEDVASTAGCVWFAGLALSRYLVSVRDTLVDSRVCELGAGCCVPGLISAVLGAGAVCVTDLAVNVPHMESIIRLNKDRLCCPVTANVLKFGECAEFGCSSFDIILGADIGFDLGLHSLIKNTLLSLCDEKTRIILCEEVRWKDIFGWYVEELETNFLVHIVDIPSTPIMGINKDIKILILDKKPLSEEVMNSDT